MHYGGLSLYLLSYFSHSFRLEKMPLGSMVHASDGSEPTYSGSGFKRHPQKESNRSLPGLSCLMFVWPLCTHPFIRFVPVRPFSAMLPSSVSTPSFTSSPTSTCTDPQLNPKEANEFLVSIPISRDDTALAPAIPTYEISVFLDPLTLPVPPAPARTSHSYHIV